MHVDLRKAYERDGYVAPIRILETAEAAKHRRAMEQAETKVGPLHYMDKVHTILRSPLELATHPVLLDVAEALLGPNVLLYNATYIVKEARTPAHVSWHQDLTYWGFDSDAQVSAWLALSPATEASGCMRMLPGSHKNGRHEHSLMRDKANVLYGGQTVADVNESAALLCPLEPGEASFHHGWTLHASLSNNSDDRRIGLNIQYIAPQMRQTLHESDSALLVRGVDEHRHFEPDIPAAADLEPDAVARQKVLKDRLETIYARATA